MRNATLHVIELLEIFGSHGQVYIVKLGLYTATEEEKKHVGTVTVHFSIRSKHERHA